MTVKKISICPTLVDEAITDHPATHMATTPNNALPPSYCLNGYPVPVKRCSGQSRSRDFTIILHRCSPNENGIVHPERHALSQVVSNVKLCVLEQEDGSTTPENGALPPAQAGSDGAQLGGGSMIT